MTAIYLLKDPTTYEIRYVGKSVNPTARYSKHLFESKKKGKKNYLYCWIRSLIIKDLKPLMEIIEYCDNWQEREKFWINYYSNEKLTNLSEGGVGSTGYKHTEEWKRAASERMKNNKIMTGRKLSEETKKKIGKSNTGKIFTNERKMKISKALKGNQNGVGRIVTEETRKNISISHIGINRGEKNGRAMAITNENEVIAIRNDYNNGMTIRDLQIKYCRKYMLIYNIVKRITWNWLNDSSLSG